MDPSKKNKKHDFKQNKGNAFHPKTMTDRYKISSDIILHNDLAFPRSNITTAFIPIRSSLRMVSAVRASTNGVIR